MSHQTGIQASEQLGKFFGRCRDGKIRAVKVCIDKEQLVLAKTVDELKDNCWDKNFDKLIMPLVEENQPCYILYRLDTKNEMGYEWLFISWSPDTSPVREKMLYASTKATFKQQFGTAQIKEEIHGTVLPDITLEGYRKYKRAAITPAPLTTREEELQELKRTEIHTDYGIDSKHQTLSGVAFPITELARQAILDMARGVYDYVQFRIDIEGEKIHLVGAENFKIEKLATKVPDNSARYHLYKFKHTHEGDYFENIVFIYSMPGYNCSIKERMLYSSCKNPLTDIICNLGVEIVKKVHFQSPRSNRTRACPTKSTSHVHDYCRNVSVSINLEIDSGSELTKEFLYEEIHPTKNLHRPKFAKPKGPPGRGPKRMTKTQPASN